jgi:DNA-binding MarR family transcriptional regulator
MKIEDEIKQKKFRSELSKLAVNLLFTGNWFNANQIKFFKSHGLSPQQYNILRILRGQHPKAASVGLLLERMLDRSSNVTRLIDKLIEKKLVSRRENKENRRMQDIQITDKGLQLLETLDPLLIEHEMELLKISESDAAIMNELLDKMRG